MTPYEIIEDIKSDRVKKVIFDGDTGADGDDQFALGLALRSPRMNVVAANSAPFNDDMELSSYCFFIYLKNYLSYIISTLLLYNKIKYL